MKENWLNIFRETGKPHETLSVFALFASGEGDRFSSCIKRAQKQGFKIMAAAAHVTVAPKL